MSVAGPLPLLLGALAGLLAAGAVRELAFAMPQLARGLRAAIEPLRRAGDEGYDPTRTEMRRLGLIGALAALISAVVIGGLGPLVLVAGLGPVAVAWVVTDRRRRYRRAVDSGMAEIATAIADALTGGGGVRKALISAAASIEGPPGVEMRRVASEVTLGVPTAEALRGLQRRLRSPGVDSLAAALVSGQLGGGDLAGLLRRFARSAIDRERVLADARSATAQARFTGLIVVAMPAGAAVFGELTSPGFIAGVIADPAAALMLAMAAVLQLVGFVAIKRLGAVAP